MLFPCSIDLLYLSLPHLSIVFIMCKSIVEFVPACFYFGLMSQFLYFISTRWNKGQDTGTYTRHLALSADRRAIERENPRHQGQECTLEQLVHISGTSRIQLTIPPSRLEAPG